MLQWTREIFHGLEYATNMPNPSEPLLAPVGCFMQKVVNPMNNFFFKDTTFSVNTCNFFVPYKGYIIVGHLPDAV